MAPLDEESSLSQARRGGRGGTQHGAHVEQMEHGGTHTRFPAMEMIRYVDGPGLLATSRFSSESSQ